MARRKVEVRREEILAATVDEVSRRGLAGTRVGDVAEALGISPGLVFYHFDTKDALLAAALEYAVERDLARLDGALSDRLDATDRLRRVLAMYWPQGSAPGWTLWIDAWAAALRQPAIRSTLRRLDRRWQQTLSDAIEAGVRQEVFVCPDPMASVARVGALLDGLSVAAMVHRSVTRSQLRSWVREAVAAELGLRPDDLR